MEIKLLNGHIAPKSFGKKAGGLAWLLKNDFNVPNGIVLSIKREELSIIEDEEFQKKFYSYFNELDSKLFVVRSSTKIEDKFNYSSAGIFKTIIDVKKTYILGAMQSVATQTFRQLKEKQPHQNQIGIIIQEQINSLYSGILFTSNPINGLKNQSLISAYKGKGNILVSGLNTGTTYSVSDNKFEKLAGNESLPESIIHTLKKELKKVLNKIEYPSNFEWVMDSQSKIWFVQIRPITGINCFSNYITTAGKEYEFGINKEKNNLRFYANKFGLKISKGWKLKIATVTSKDKIGELLSKNIKSNFDLFSAVVLKPSLREGKVFRKFVFYENLTNEIFQICSEYHLEYLFIEIIVKEIYPSHFTGMIRKIQDGYFIELGRGHYLPKGVAQTSVFMLNKSFEIVDKQINLQKEYFEIHPIKAKKFVYNKKPFVSSIIIQNVASTYSRLLDEDDFVLEFGILSNNEIVLLDYVHNEKPSKENPMNTGIISEGLIRGKLLKAFPNRAEMDIFELHKKNIIVDQSSSDKEFFIYYSQRPSMDLMHLISKHDKIGFVFSELSFLNHFVITLREKNIPAIWYPNKIKPFLGKYIELDALTPGIEPMKRMVQIKQILI